MAMRIKIEFLNKSLQNFDNLRRSIMPFSVLLLLLLHGSVAGAKTLWILLLFCLFAGSFV